ncbi:MAG: PP2C family protein-serine/threonine phosphatase, partial [Bacteroidota bacterium]
FPYSVAGGGGEFVTLAKGGLPLGMFESMPYESETIDIHANDHLYFYTDGVTEAMNSDLDEYGEDRFKKAISATLNRTVKEQKSSLLADIHTFTGAEPQSDDLTLMVLRRAD